MKHLMHLRKARIQSLCLFNQISHSRLLLLVTLQLLLLEPFCHRYVKERKGLLPTAAGN